MVRSVSPLGTMVITYILRIYSLSTQVGPRWLKEQGSDMEHGPKKLPFVKEFEAM